jgi:CYTH domain
MLRVRRIGDRYVQTIKAMTNAGPFERDEWQAEIGGDAPELSLAYGTALEPLMTHRLRQRLKPLFETRVRRTLYPIVDETRAIAMTVDRGTIDTGSRSLPLYEIELELKRGDRAELFRLARELAQAVPLEPIVKSKSQRGYELIQGEWNLPIKAAPGICVIGAVPDRRRTDAGSAPPHQRRDLRGHAGERLHAAAAPPGFLHCTCGARDLVSADKIERINELRIPSMTMPWILALSLKAASRGASRTASGR